MTARLSGLVRLCTARPHLWLTGLLVITLVAIAGMARLELRTDGAAIHPLGNPVVEHTKRDRAAFFERDQVIVLVTARDGVNPVESTDGLARLKELHTSLEALPEVNRGRVRSLVNLPDPRRGVPFARTGDFLDDIPDPGPDHADLVERIHGMPTAEGVYLSPDGRMAAIYAPMARDGSRAALMAAVERWADDNRDEAYDLQLTGPVAVEALLGRAVLQDLVRLVPLVVLAVTALLWGALRSAGSVLVALAEVGLVLTWTLGAMGWLGAPVTLLTAVLPVLLVCMAVTDEIHLLERFQAHLATGAHDVPEAMEAAAGDVGVPIVWTSVTTSLAFLSFTTASIDPMRDFGWFAALGIVVAMALSFTLVPALAALLPARWFGGGREPVDVLWGHERLAVRHRFAAFAVGVALVAACATGLHRLTVQDAWVDNFDPQSDIARADAAHNAHLWGSYRFDVVMEAPADGFFTTAGGLRLMERLHQIAEAAPAVGGVASHLVPVEVLAASEGDALPVSALPADRVRLHTARAQVLKYRVDLDQYLDAQARRARARLFVESADYRRGVALRRHLDTHLVPILEEAGLQTHYSGDLPVAVEVVGSVVGNQLRSIGWTLGGVAVALVLLFGSPLRAAACVLPVVCAVVAVLGGMGWTSTPLGIATSMFSALTVGVGVDFAIHFTHAVRRGHDDTVSDALAVAFRTAGRAIRFNVVTLGAGFALLGLSALKPNQGLGALLAVSMVVCYAATVTLLPWLSTSVAGGAQVQS